MNNYLQAARVLDGLSDHMLVDSIRETDPARREWVDGRLKYYVGRSEEINSQWTVLLYGAAPLIQKCATK